LSGAKLRRLLSLPEGAAVIGMRYDLESDAVVMRIEGPDLPEVAEGARPPDADLAMRDREDRGASEIVVFALEEPRRGYA
jgi:hypothetical protein